MKIVRLFFASKYPIAFNSILVIMGDIFSGEKSHFPEFPKGPA